MMLTSLRVPDDDRARTGTLQRFGADVSGERTENFRAAILPTNRDSSPGDLNRFRDQRRGHAD